MSKNLDINSKIKQIKTNNKFSHAYIIESSDEKKTEETTILLFKSILCDSYYDESHSESDCNKCQKINNHKFLEIDYIEPEGLNIKIDQIKTVQKKLTKKAFTGEKKIYVIKKAERLGNRNSNALLKLIEEPEENIFCLLITNNYYSLIPTVRSRCQRLKISSDNDFHYDQEVIAISAEILNLLENEEYSGILEIGNIIEKKSKEEVVQILEIVIQLLKDKIISSEQKKEINMIKKIIGYRNKVFSNVNIALLFDKMFIEIGVNNND